VTSVTTCVRNRRTVTPQARIFGSRAAHQRRKWHNRGPQWTPSLVSDSGMVAGCPNARQEIVSPVTFKVGDHVVYPHHGAAVITHKETRAAFGVEQEYLVIETTHEGLTVSVPVDKVHDVGVRPPIGEQDVADVMELLRKKDVREPANWSRRFKNHQEKLKSGDIYQVAEVVRNLSLRENNKGLSAAEKTMLLESQRILVSELSLSWEVTEDEAFDRVNAELV
jgi:CarD family transcriptional regulator, regulator of rRNA transcription